MSAAVLLAVPVLPFAGALVLARWGRMHPLLAGAVPGMLGGFAGWLLRQRRIRRDRTG